MAAAATATPPAVITAAAATATAAVWQRLAAQRLAPKKPAFCLPRAVVTLLSVLFSSLAGLLYGMQVPQADEIFLVIVAALVLVIVLLILASFGNGANLNNVPAPDLSVPARAARTVRVLVGAPASKVLLGLAWSQFGLLCGIQLLVVVMAVRGLYLGKMPLWLCAALVGYSIGFAFLGALYGDLGAGFASSGATKIFVAAATAAIAAGCWLLSH